MMKLGRRRAWKQVEAGGSVCVLEGWTQGKGAVSWECSPCWGGGRRGLAIAWGLKLCSAPSSMLEGTTPPASPHSLNPAASFAAHKRGCFWNSGEIRHGGLFWGWGKSGTNMRTCGIQNVGEAGDRNKDEEKGTAPSPGPPGPRAQPRGGQGSYLWSRPALGAAL